MFHASMSDSSLTSTVKILKIILFFSTFFLLLFLNISEFHPKAIIRYYKDIVNNI